MQFDVHLWLRKPLYRGAKLGNTKQGSERNATSLPLRKINGFSSFWAEQDVLKYHAFLDLYPRPRLFGFSPAKLSFSSHLVDAWNQKPCIDADAVPLFLKTWPPRGQLCCLQKSRNPQDTLGFSFRTTNKVLAPTLPRIPSGTAVNYSIAKDPECAV